MSAIEVLYQPITPGDTQPPTLPSNLTATSVSFNRVDLSWGASVEQGGSLLVGYRIYRDGDTTPIATVTGTSYSDTGVLANTAYSYQVTAFDNAVPANESAPSTISVTTPAASTTALRINAGGSEYTDGNGQVWSADMGYSSGHLAQTNAEIAGTTDDTLYQSIRWSDSSNPVQYRLPVSNGNHQVTLQFNEIWSTSAGARLFDVKMEGSLVLDDVDIYAQAGGQNKALVLSVPVTVMDGELNIEFIHQVDNPHVSAIEVLQQ